MLRWSSGALARSPESSAKIHFVSWSRNSKQNVPTSAKANMSTVVVAASNSPAATTAATMDPTANGAVYVAQPTPNTSGEAIFACRAMSATVSQVESTSKSQALLSTQRITFTCGNSAWHSTSAASSTTTMRHSCGKLNDFFAPMTRANTTAEITTSHARPSRNTSVGAKLWLP